MTTLADVLVESLELMGVKRIYGIVGDSLNGITNALQGRKKIEWVHTRHEEVAAFAAGAEAQLTNELAVCAGSCGPGNVHLINGLYDCQRSNAPVLAIAAHIPTAEIGGDYFQETHPNILFKECSHFCEVISSIEQVPRLLNIAVQTALAKRGVAVLVISGDVALQVMRMPASLKWSAAIPPSVTPTKEIIDTLAKKLNQGKKVTVFCGIGAAKARSLVLDLCEKLQAPLVHTLRAKPFLEYDNPYDVGMTGFIGFSSGYYAMEACDTLLVLGASFPYRQFYPEKADIIQIDLDASNLGKRTPIDLGIVGDIDSTLQVLLPLLIQKKDDAHLQQGIKHYHHARKSLDERATAGESTSLIHPQFLAKVVSDKASDQTIFTCDVGTPTVWAARYLKMNGQRRLLGSFNHGSMANALAQAIGAQKSHPEQQVVALCGDGGFSMLMGDLLTLVQENLPIKIVIFNNSTLGFVEMEMHVGGMLEYSTELRNPNFSQIAEATGVRGFQVNHAQDLASIVQEAFSHKGPALLDVKVNRNELMMPPTISFAQMKGFSLYMMKAIMDGQGTAILDLVKTNLWM